MAYSIELFKQYFFFKFNPLPPQIVWLVMKNPMYQISAHSVHRKRRARNLKFRIFVEKYGVFAYFSINFAIKIPGTMALFDLILLKLHIKASLNQFVEFVL